MLRYVVRTLARKDPAFVVFQAWQARLLRTNGSIEQSVGDDGAIRAVGNGDARQCAVGRTAANRGVIGRVVDAAVARAQDELVPVELLVYGAAEMCADGAEGHQAAHAVAGRYAHDLHEIVLIGVFAHRQELGRVIDRQIGSFEGLARLTTAGRIGIREHVDGRDDRFFEGEGFEGSGWHGETHAEGTGGDAYQPAQQLAAAQYSPRRGRHCRHWTVTLPCMPSWS